MGTDDKKPNYFIQEDDYDDCHYDTVEEIMECGDPNEVITFIPVYEGPAQFAVQTGKPGSWNSENREFTDYVTTIFQTLAEAEAFAKTADELQEKLEEAPEVETTEAQPSEAVA